MRMADSVQGSVSPVGSAWAWVRANYPSLGDSLYISDGSHPSLTGSYLIACTFYASLFRENPIGSSYTAGLSNTTVGILQQAAAMTVLDSLDQWNLRPLSEHTQAAFSHVQNGNTVDFDNASTKAQFYAWDFGDGNSSTAENPSHTYATQGTFVVSLVASSACDSDTSTMTITTGVNGLETQTQHARISYVGKGKFHVEYMNDNAHAALFSADGSQLKLDPAQEIIDLSSFGKGIYLLRDQRGTVHRLPYLAD
jgi:PKD repeat protein